MAGHISSVLTFVHAERGLAESSGRSVWSEPLVIGITGAVCRVCQKNEGNKRKKRPVYALCRDPLYTSIMIREAGGKVKDNRSTIFDRGKRSRQNGTTRDL